MYKYKSWVVSAGFTFHTGSPTLVSTSNKTYQFERLDNFSQLDFALIKRFSYKGFSMEGGASFLNVLNKQNIIGSENLVFADQESTTSVKSNTTSIPFTPVFFLNFRF